MANVVDLLKGYITPDLLSLASSRLGESETSVSRGLHAAIPLIMSAMLQKTSDPSILSQIMSLFTSRSSSPDVLGNLRGVLSGDPSTSAQTDLGSNLLSLLFGRQLGSATSALAEHAGLKNASASSVMTLASTLITASLGDKVRREGLSPTGLVSLLSGQRDGIIRALPGTLASVAGLGAARNLGEGAKIVARETERRTSGLGWLPWAAVAALMLLALGWAALRNRGPDVDTTKVASSASDAARKADAMARQAADGAVKQGQVAVANLGEFMTRRLPSAIELSVPERGVESQVIAYLDDPSRQLEPVVWFNFDRLLFETGSATLKPESHEQLKNVAEIMKAYPTVKMKIGGYTDNVGDPMFNVKLSQDRATNVAAAIMAMGITPDRLSAEGFGEQYPVADNSTEEGRQQNRRIALRVTEK